MAQTVTLYNLLISCPGDVKEEVSLVESAVDEFNELYAEPLGLTIKTRFWRKSAYSQSGGKPQELLNEQFVKKCDAAVAIFWLKFGSPTDEYGSGTEEEIEIMLQSGKQVFMYFSDKQVSPSQMNSEEYKKIQAFREKYKDRGIYYTYSSNDEFKKLFFAHLSMYFLSEKKLKETTDTRLSKLKLMGIDADGNLSDEASVYQFTINAPTTMAEFLETIKKKYSEIADLHVGKRTTNESPYAINIYSPVTIEEKQRNFLIYRAEELGIELPKDFFDIGNLEQSLLGSTFGSSLEGTDEEIKKYNDIQDLHITISDALDWAPIERSFSDHRCMRLALQNCGKAIDEDIEIVLEFPKKSLLTVEEFPTFSNEEMRYLLKDCDICDLFGINGTAEYISYSESKVKHNLTYNPSSFEFPGYVPDYSEEYANELRDAFCYSIYPQGDKYLVKLKVDYIKHNTSVAFPTILFITDYIKEVPYRITSKNNPNIVEGILKVRDSVAKQGPFV